MNQYKAAVVGGSFGRQAKAIGLGELDGFLDWLVNDGDEKAGPQELYKAVAYTFWCLRLRANNIGRIPYLVYPIDVEEDEADKDVEWPLDLRPTLWNVEAWLTLKGASYALKHFDQQVLEELQILNANTMKVLTWDDRGKPTSFEQKLGIQRRIFPAEDIIYFRTFDPKDDIREGVASGQVARMPGTLVQNSNLFATDFFGNGGFPAVILTTEGAVPKSEKDRIQNVWNKMLQGVGNFFRTVVLERGLTPTIVGSPIKDLAMPELALESRMQILAAHDLPAGLAEPKLSVADRIELDVVMWKHHLIPYCKVFVEPVLNEQLFKPLGLRVSLQYQEIEALQREELAKSESMAFTASIMQAAYDANVASVKEYRSLLESIFASAGLHPLEANFTPEERTPPQLLAANEEEDETENPFAERVEGRLPKSAVPKVAAPRWGRHHISLQS